MLPAVFAYAKHDLGLSEDDMRLCMVFVFNYFKLYNKPLQPEELLPHSTEANVIARDTFFLLGHHWTDQHHSHHLLDQADNTMLGALNTNPLFRLRMSTLHGVFLDLIAPQAFESYGPEL